MLRNGIAQFVGSWVSQFGYRLRVEKVRRDRAVVDFLDPRGAPIVRPYMGGAPSMKMIAHYDDYNEDFRVDLWEESKGFILHLDHECGYVLDPEQREALVPAISRYERDRFLDAYCFSDLRPNSIRRNLAISSFSRSISSSREASCSSLLRSCSSL